MNKKVAFYTLGCKLNFSETSTIGKLFIDKGYQIVDFNNQADVYVINTCTVTDSADKECRQIVRKALKTNPDAFIAVTGCYAQIASDEIINIKGVDAVFGTNDKFELLNKLNEFEKINQPFVCVTPLNQIESFYNAFSTDADSRTRAFLKIQDGCDYTCSYCTIPLARGKSRNPELNVLIEEFKNLLSQGYKEIILTGVNIGEYIDSNNNKLENLVESLLRIDGDFRIRFGSIEPNLITDKIIQLVKESSKLCNHFHIPLQSGSEKILKLMQRRYNINTFIKLIEKINNEITNCGIGIDIITGFPGEGEKEFNETYMLLEKLSYSYLHVFSYSERANTKAISLPDKVATIDKKERTKRLRKLSEKKQSDFMKNNLGKEHIVLFEHNNKDGKISGFSENYLRIETDFDKGKINKLSKEKPKEIKNKKLIS